MVPKPHALRDDDPHRLRCPRGHSGWKPINGGFWCPACERWAADGAFKQVTDAKTGEQLGREEVRRLERDLADQEASA